MPPPLRPLSCAAYPFPLQLPCCPALLQNLPKEMLELESREHAVAVKEAALEDANVSVQHAQKEAERYATLCTALCACLCLLCTSRSP